MASNRESRSKYAPAVNRDLQEIDSNLSMRVKDDTSIIQKIKSPFRLSCIVSHIGLLTLYFRSFLHFYNRGLCPMAPSEMIEIELVIHFSREQNAIKGNHASSYK